MKLRIGRRRCWLRFHKDARERRNTLHINVF
jgi:hypothetical protein